MATRPIFTPLPGGFPFVDEVGIEFDWHPGFAVSQAQKSIRSLHAAAESKGIAPVLEISTRSPDPLGEALSAFNIRLTLGGKQMSVECAFQGSKVFERGGPYTELYDVSSREAKTESRLRTSGELVAFRILGEDFPTKPVTAFYDWLYIYALSQNPDLAARLLGFKGFSDIAFNPKKSVNCQARAAALYVALEQLQEIDHVINDRDYFIRLMTNPRNGSD